MEHGGFTPDDKTAGGPGNSSKSKKANKGENMPTLDMLCYNLEAANSHPNQALKFLQALYMDAETISGAHESSISGLEDAFRKGKDTNQIQEMIETFMQNAQLLVDNHFEFRSIILSILSKLTIINCHNFGVRCFNTLKDLMIAGKELEK